MEDVILKLALENAGRYRIIAVPVMGGLLINCLDTHQHLACYSRLSHYQLENKTMLEAVVGDLGFQLRRHWELTH